MRNEEIEAKYDKRLVITLKLNILKKLDSAQNEIS